jgi:hypothetical protein
MCWSYCRRRREQTAKVPGGRVGLQFTIGRWRRQALSAQIERAEAQLNLTLLRQHGWFNTLAGNLPPAVEVILESPRLRLAEGGSDSARFDKKGVAPLVKSHIGGINVVSGISSNDICSFRNVSDVDPPSWHFRTQNADGRAFTCCRRAIPCSRRRRNPRTKLHWDVLCIFLATYCWPISDHALATDQGLQCKQHQQGRLCTRSHPNCFLHSIYETLHISVPSVSSPVRWLSHDRFKGSKNAARRRRFCWNWLKAYNVDSISNPQASRRASGMYLEFLLRRAHSRRRVDRMY